MIHIEGIHVTITEAMQAHAEAKLAELFSRSDRASKLELEVSENNDAARSFTVKGILHMDGMDHIVASATDEDAYKAINDRSATLLRQLRRIKRAKIAKRH